MKQFSLVSTLLMVTLICSACATSTTSVTSKNEDIESSRSVPPLRPLQLLDEVPSVEHLGNADGIYAYRVGDLTVLHKPTPANSVVSAQLYLLGGSTNLTDNTAGIEQLALNSAASGGTQSTPKDDFNATLNAVGSSINAFFDRDFSGYAMRTVVEHFDSTWDLFVETIVEPALLHDEIELQRTRQLADIRSMFENPDRHVGHLATQLLFGDHPYKHLQLGEEDTVSEFSAEEIRAYQRALLAPERMLLVVVGDIEHDVLLEKVQERLGRLISTNNPLQEIPEFQTSENAIVVEEKALPTNYIFGLFSAPSSADEDYPAMLLATRHLRDRLFEEVRTKRNLTYAVSAGLGNQRANYGYLYVTAVEPANTIPVILEEVEKLKQNAVTDQELEEIRNVFLTSYYMDMETNANQASMLARAYIVTGDWQHSIQFLEKIQAVTPADIQRVADLYFKNYQFGVVGTPDANPTDIYLHN